MYGIRTIVAVEPLGDVRVSHGGREQGVKVTPKGEISGGERAYTAPSARIRATDIFVRGLRERSRTRKMGMMIPSVQSPQALMAAWAYVVSSMTSVLKHEPGRPEYCSQKYEMGRHWKTSRKK